MTTEYSEVPEVLAVVLSRIARAILQGVDTFLATGDHMHLVNYASILHEYEDESHLLLRGWVEVLSIREFSLRPVDHSLIQGYDFSGAEVAWIVGLCRFTRPDPVLMLVHPDEPAYCLSVPGGMASGIAVQRLHLL